MMLIFFILFVLFVIRLAEFSEYINHAASNIHVCERIVERNGKYFGICKFCGCECQRDCAGHWLKTTFN